MLSTLGLLYLEQGQPQKAFEYLGSALTYDPRNNKVRYFIKDMCMLYSVHAMGALWCSV